MRGKRLLWMPLAAMLIVSMSVITATGSTTAHVYTSPDPAVADPGEFVTVWFNIDNAAGLWGWEVMVSHDPSITPYAAMEYDGIGGMKWTAEMVGLGTTFGFSKHPGYFLMTTIFTAPITISGSFPLANVTFLVLDPVKTPLHFEYVTLLDPAADPLPSTSDDGLVYTWQPVASFEITPAFHVVPLAPPHYHVGDVLTFDSTSFDPDECQPAPAGITAYSWDLGDGTTKTTQSFTHSYSKPGEYVVTLNVTDNDGAMSTKSLLVPVTGPPEIVSIDYSPYNPRLMSDTVEEITLEATVEEVAGTIVKWEWDFGDGDSETIVYPESGDTVTHTYPAVADVTYTVTLTVTDNEDNTDTDTITVSVYQYYEANLIMKRVDPSRRPRAGETVTFVGMVKNDDLSNYPLDVKVVFDVYDEEGEKIDPLETFVVTIGPGEESGELSVEWTAVEGRYFGTATAWYSVDGVLWDVFRTGTKTKTFSFEVRP